MSEQNQQYWNERALKSRGAPSATTDDFYLRELEFETLLVKIGELYDGTPGRALDVGCGDGLTTLRLAEALPAWTFVGVDYADHMIELAQRRLAETEESVRQRVQFRVGDATRIEAAVGDSRFDLVTSGRCLINLDSSERQYEALQQLADRLINGGHYLGIENFLEGHDNMNRARSIMDLEPISVRWHNLFFVEQEFYAHANRIFELVDIIDFSSSYYFATRVVYSALCKSNGETPDYLHDIHRHSMHLPPIGQFSPIKLIVARRA